MKLITNQALISITRNIINARREEGDPEGLFDAEVFEILVERLVESLNKAGEAVT